MANIIAELQAVLTTANNLMSPPPYIGNFDFGNPTLPATAFYSDVYQALAGAVAISFPIVPVFCLMVQNITPTNQILNVSFTPTAGVSQLYVLGPHGIFLYFDPTETGQGIIAASLQGVGGTVPAFVAVGA